jgi:hypothetical protein
VTGGHEFDRRTEVLCLAGHATYRTRLGVKDRYGLTLFPRSSETAVRADVRCADMEALLARRTPDRSHDDHDRISTGDVW